MIITRALLTWVNLISSGPQARARYGNRSNTAGAVVALLIGMLMVCLIPIDVVLTIVIVVVAAKKRKRRQQQAMSPWPSPPAR